MNLLAPDGVGDEEPLLEKRVDQVCGFGIGPTQQFDGDDGLLGAVAALEPMLQRLQFLGSQFTRRLRRHHHGSNDGDSKHTSKNKQTSQVCFLPNTHTHTRSCYFPPELPLLLRHTGSLFGRRSAEPSFGNLTNGVSTSRPGRQTKTRRCPSFVIVQPRIGNERE